MRDSQMQQDGMKSEDSLLEFNFLTPQFYGSCN